MSSNHYLQPLPPPLPLACFLPLPAASDPASLEVCCRMTHFSDLKAHSTYETVHVAYFVSSMLRETSPPDPFSSGPSSSSSFGSLDTVPTKCTNKMKPYFSNSVPCPHISY